MSFGKVSSSFSKTDLGRCGLGHEVCLILLKQDDGKRLAEVFAAMDPWSDYGISTELLEQYLMLIEPGAPRLGIVVDERVVGACGLRTNWLRGPYLQFLGIEPDFQRRGLGGLVLSWFEREARRDGCSNLWVMVSQMNRKARLFYEAHGFAKECEISDLAVIGRDEILMRKRLKPENAV